MLRVLNLWHLFKKKYIIRCAWCGEKSSKELGLVSWYVSSLDWANGSQNLYHRQCVEEKIKSSHRSKVQEAFN